MRVGGKLLNRDGDYGVSLNGGYGIVRYPLDGTPVEVPGAGAFVAVTDGLLEGGIGDTPCEVILAEDPTGHRAPNGVVCYRRVAVRAVKRLRIGPVEVRPTRSGNIIVRCYYDTGALHTEERYRGGKPHGTWRRWHESGVLRAETRYRDGKLHGLFRRWYESGALQHQAHHRDDKAHGTSRSWWPSGAVQWETHYRDGKAHGTSRTWCESGALRFEERYRDGRRHGMWRGWYESGALRFEKRYRNGRRHGTSRTWYESGALRSEKRYRDGKPLSSDALPG